MVPNLPRLSLTLLEYHLAVCQLSPDETLPDWVKSSAFWSVTRSDEELSIVCEEELVPAVAGSEPGWRALKVAGPLDFNLTGVLSALLEPLARAGISIFAISTYNTDYVLVKQHQLEKAVLALRAAGHTIYTG